MGFDVLLAPGEAEQFQRSPHLRRLTVVHTLSNGYPLHFLRKAENPTRCIALDGTLGAVCCRIYAERPSLCREFVVGSPDCLAARRAMGLDAAEAPLASA